MIFHFLIQLPFSRTKVQSIPDKIAAEDHNFDNNKNSVALFQDKNSVDAAEDHNFDKREQKQGILLF